MWPVSADLAKRNVSMKFKMFRIISIFLVGTLTQIIILSQKAFTEKSKKEHHERLTELSKMQF
jgi:hypothetical protein